MRLDIAAQTDVGRRKQKNEDFYGVFREGTPGLRLFNEGALVCVADGLGGHTGGEIASKLAVSMLKDMLNEEPTGNPDEEGPLPQMRRAMQRANESIFKTNRDLVQAHGTEGRVVRPMGTTLLSAIISPKFAHIGNIGDSRAYHIRGGEVITRTEDHSWVDEQVKLGMMSKAEAELDRRKNVVTRCVGTHEEIVVDTYRWSIVPGDMLLLCTDGLVNMVQDRDIIAEFRKGGTAAEIAQRLVALANENGGKDNITVIIVSINPPLPMILFMRLRSLLRKLGLSLGWLFFLLLYGLACAAGGYALHMFNPLF